MQLLFFFNGGELNECQYIINLNEHKYNHQTQLDSCNDACTARFTFAVVEADYPFISALSSCFIIMQNEEKEINIHELACENIKTQA